MPNATIIHRIIFSSLDYFDCSTAAIAQCRSPVSWARSGALSRVPALAGDLSGLVGENEKVELPLPANRARSAHHGAGRRRQAGKPSRRGAVVVAQRDRSNGASRATPAAPPIDVAVHLPTPPQHVV
jgi:hypothetical protein